MVAALDLISNSHGNAIDVGHADLIIQRLCDKIDFAATYTSCLTSHNLASAEIPLTLPTAHDVIEAGLARTTPSGPRVVVYP